VFGVDNGDLKWKPAAGKYTQNHQQHYNHLVTITQQAATGTKSIQVRGNKSLYSPTTNIGRVAASGVAAG